MPLDRPLPDEPREALKMLWSVAEDQQVDINRHRDSLHKVWHVAPAKPREGMLVYADGVHWNPGSGAGYYVYYAGAWHPMSGSGGGGGGGITVVQDEGVALPVQSTLNFVGARVTATNDAGGSRTTVTIPGGGAGSQTPWLSNINANSFRLDNALAVGIGKVPTFPLDVLGDCNITGKYFIGGVQIAAANVTNAVSTLGSYPNPTWIPSYAYSKLTGVPTSFTPAAHVHDAADVTTGVMAVARLGTGTPSSANYLRGDGAWTALPAGMAQTPWLSDINGNNKILYGVAAIGIQVPSPSVALQVAGQIWSTASTVIMEHTAHIAGYGRIGTLSPHPVLFYADSLERMRIDAAGLVGIGGMPVAGIRLNVTGNWVQIQDAGVDMRVGAVGVGIRGTYTAKDLVFSTNSVEKMRITSAGLVGIGKLPSTYRLEVSGDVDVTGGYRINGVPLALGQPQTPWAQNIAGGSFALHSVSSISIGTPQTTRTGVALAVVNGSPTSAAAACQIAIGEGGNNTGYQLNMGYALIGGTFWAGCVQALAGGSGTPLFLQPSGGGLMIEHQYTNSAAIPNGSLMFYLRQSDNVLLIYARRTDGTLRTAQLATT